MSKAMNKQDDKWLPEVGQECEWLKDGGMWQSGYVQYRSSGGNYLFKEPNGTEYLLPNGTVFRPIKTAAEKRREEKIKNLCDDITIFYYLTDYPQPSETAKHLVRLGWTKPEPLTDEQKKLLTLEYRDKCWTTSNLIDAVQNAIFGEK